jgi:uncharacterized damage-inducible protein DinB
MFSLPLVQELLRYTEWADAAVWRAVLATPAAGRDDTIRNYLVHIHMVQRAFLSAWKGEPPTFTSGSEFVDLEAVRAWGRPYYAEVGGFLAVLGADTDRPMKMPWVDQYEQHVGRTFATSSIGETIYQVVSHSTYHRGQVNARLRAVGGEPPLVDYIAWTWFGKPEAEWS